MRSLKKHKSVTYKMLIWLLHNCIHDYLVTGTCIGTDIRQHYSCIVCSRKLEESIFTDDTVTCPNCQITTLVSLLKTKLVCQLVIKVGEKIATYTAFNDAVQSFLANLSSVTVTQPYQMLTLKC